MSTMANGVSTPISSQIAQALSGVLRLSSQPSQSSEPNPPEVTNPQATEPTGEADDDDDDLHPSLLPPMSSFSTPALGHAAWCASDILLGAGVVIIQRNTHKIVVIHENRKKYWFFPRGRKDVGESIEHAAFREAYEESGFRAQPLPLLIPTRQPLAPNSRYRAGGLNTEPIFMTMMTFPPGRGLHDYGGQYLTTWYVGQIDEHAVAEQGTGMPDEQNYQSHLFSFDEAMEKVFGDERRILQYVWDIYCHTLNAIQHLRARQAEEARRRAEQRARHASSPITFFSRRRSV